MLGSNDKPMWIESQSRVLHFIQYSFGGFIANFCEIILELPSSSEPK